MSNLVLTAIMIYLAVSLTRYVLREMALVVNGRASISSLCFLLGGNFFLAFVIFDTWQR